MTGKTITVPKPKSPKPVSPKPVSPKPASVKPLKAEGHGSNCIRCTAVLTAETGVVRKVCSACDLELQTMHWNSEYSLLGKTYTKEQHPEGPSFAWLQEHDWPVTRPPQPKHRNFFRPELEHVSTLAHPI